MIPQKNSPTAEGMVIGLIAISGAFHIAKYLEMWWLIVPAFFIISLILLMVVEK